MEKIISYFVNEKGVTEVVAKVLSKNISKYQDIKDEFIYWIDNRSFQLQNPVEINGYNASIIHKKAPFLDAAGVYNLLVTLRDNPDKALEYLKNGFPRK